MLQIRKVIENDCRMLWEWRNDPKVREMSFSTGFVSWEEHQKWFAAKLNRSDNYFFVAVDENSKPIGQVRFEITHSRKVEIHISITSSMRGMGRGRELIKAGIDNIFSSTTVEEVSGYIKPNNAASLKFFERAKFIKQGLVEKSNQQALHMIRKRSSWQFVEPI